MTGSQGGQQKIKNEKSNLFLVELIFFPNCNSRIVTFSQPGWKFSDHIPSGKYRKEDGPSPYVTNLIEEK